MTEKQAPKRVVKGDVFAIPIEGLGFAYARECFGAQVCVFDVVTAEVAVPLDLKKVTPLFWTGFFWHGGIRNGDWPIVLRKPLTAEDGWGPPTREMAIYKGKMRRVWEKGNDRLVPDDQTSGMPFTGSVSPKGLIEEIMSRRGLLRNVSREEVTQDDIEQDDSPIRKKSPESPKSTRRRRK